MSDQTIEVPGARSVKEWVGKTPDAPVPPRVRLRVLARGRYQCAVCGGYIATGVPWTCDHTVAIVNGGENRESNLRVICNKLCLKPKDRADVAEKSRTYKKRAAHYGIKRRKGRPMPGSRASGLKKKMDGTVIRR